MLARQIAGKTVKEALIQMRFSKKRVATEVAKHLEHARDEAIVKWGMGLGKVEGRQGNPLDIQLKDGKRKKIVDHTEIYIDQAWVGRGEYEPEIEYRARGQMNILKKPYASKFLPVLILRLQS
jgi:ribosomal protein L22